MGFTCNVFFRVLIFFSFSRWRGDFREEKITGVEGRL